MPAAVEWDNVKKLDPLTLHESYKDELDSVINLLTSTNVWEVERQSQEDVEHILRVFQALLKMKHREATLAEELVEAQERNENALLGKVSRLEEELSYTGTGPDNRFLRNETRQLKGQLVRKEEMINQLKKEIYREKKTTEKLFSRAEVAEEDLKILKRENTQLQQDIDFYQEELALKESDVSKNENAETQRKLISTTRQLTQCMDNLLKAEEEISLLKADTLRMEKCVMDSTKEMEKMSNEYNQIKMAVHQCDTETDKLRKERDHAKLQIKDLTQKINDMTEEDGPIIAAVDAQVDKWKKVLSEKDEEILVYQQMIREIQQKLRMAQMDTERNNILALQQALDERDDQIKFLREQVEQYTIEMKKQTVLMEGVKVPKKESGIHQRKMKEFQLKWNSSEVKAAEAEEALKVAQTHAEEKDREIIELSKRLTEYERGIRGLEEAVCEIRECKIQIQRKDLDLEAATKEINQAYITIEQIAEENEDFRERLGYEPSQFVDLSPFRRARGLKQWQYRAENKILSKEIERLEEERLEMKKQVRNLAKQTVLPPSMLKEDNIARIKELEQTLTQKSNVPENEEPQVKACRMQTGDNAKADKRILVETFQGEPGEAVVMIPKTEAELRNYQLRSKRPVLLEETVLKQPPTFTQNSNENEAAKVKGEVGEDAVMKPKRQAEVFNYQLQPNRLPPSSISQEENVPYVKQPPTLTQKSSTHENQEAYYKLSKTHHMPLHDISDEVRSIPVVTCQGECGKEAMMMMMMQKEAESQKFHLKQVEQWEEAKKWQSRLDKVKNVLKDKEQQNDFLSMQLTSLKDVNAKLEREKNMMQRKIKAKGLTNDPVVEEPHLSAKLPQSMKVCEAKNQSLEEILQLLQKQISNKSLEASLVPKKDSGVQLQSDKDLEKENLKLASENHNLRLQLAEVNLDLPTFKVEKINIPESVAAETDFATLSNVTKDIAEWEHNTEETDDLPVKIPKSDTDDIVPKNLTPASEAEKDLSDSDIEEDITCL
ncbi:centrosomal protein of 290 kDa-like isoform X2 [Stigmatopora nigra]